MEESQLKKSEKTESALDTARHKTRAYVRNLWDIIARYSDIDNLVNREAAVQEIPERFEYRRKGFLYILTFFPYLLLITFLGSFFWDFQGVSAEVFGYYFEFEGILKIISVSGLIGFLTNWLAITMLFKPSQKRPILGYGLIPAQKDRIAYRLAQAVSEDLINPEIIKRKIHESQVISRYREQATDYLKGIIDSPEFRYELKQWVVNYVDDMIADPEIRTAIAEKILVEIEESLEGKSIEKVALKAYSFVKGQEMQEIIEESLTRIPTSIESGLDRLDDLLDRLPEKIDEHSEAIENVVTSLLYKLVNQLDVHSLVEDNLRKYDEQRISDIIRGATNEQLKYIQYLGAILGTIGGLVIWEPLISVLILGFLTVLILGLDALLFRFHSDRIDEI